MEGFFAHRPSKQQLDPLQSYFRNTPYISRRFRWVDVVGSGSYGVCVRLKEFAPGGRQAARQQYEQNGYLLGPMLVIELLENGSMKEFLNKAKAHSAPRLPNRLLWRFFLCLARACVAMAFPRRFEGGQSLEDIPGRQSSTLRLYTHTDMHVNNVMLGGLNAQEFEHQISPILKLIDFGVWSPALENDLRTRPRSSSSRPTPGTRTWTTTGLAGAAGPAQPAGAGVARPASYYAAAPGGAAQEADEAVGRLLQMVLRDALPG
ncbi:kinase-like domain-containing protein [Apiospora phragmitis]|uniref:Kinase-like domain-containing protein n=1 Tax=Apiospora phragmitis TaxID=2905665 RepID=A0ABR1WVJ9_9PEZI